ncbi:hypothetical protein ASZ90_020014 [hydrocarbon metagenome]|uniref:Uncharacterized protein n=1 Tax=hydrocarbon metagenome TaxID=938273 RepID=A0A0W8E2N3_9ZZZZ
MNHHSDGNGPLNICDSALQPGFLQPIKALGSIVSFQHDT